VKFHQPTRSNLKGTATSIRSLQLHQ